MNKQAPTLSFLPWFLGGFPGKQGAPTYKSRRCAKVSRSAMKKIRQTASEEGASAPKKLVLGAFRSSSRGRGKDDGAITWASGFWASQPPGEREDPSGKAPESSFLPKFKELILDTP